MTGKKKYYQPKDMVLNAIHDAAIMQKGEPLHSDSAFGRVGYRITLRGAALDYKFTVGDTENYSGALVSIELAGDTEETERMIGSEFAMIDFALTDRTKIDFAEQEAWGQMIAEERRAKQGEG